MHNFSLFIQNLTTLNSNSIKEYTFTLNVSNVLANSVTYITALNSSDVKKLLKNLGASKIVSIWISEGFGDTWQMTASLYGGSIIVQIQSTFASVLSNSIEVHMLYI